MDLPDESEDLDLTLRHVTRKFPEQYARAMLPAGAEIASARCYETQATSRQRRLDRLLEVIAEGQRRIEHNEWQLEMTADVPFRVYEYNTLSAFALADETPPGQKPPRIRSTVVLLSGRETPWPAEGEYRTSPDDAPFSGVTFRIDPVYQRTVAELLARGPLGAIFAPLAVNADPERMKAVLDKLRAEHDKKDFEELTVAMTVMADKDKRQRGLRAAIISVVGVEVVMESWVFKQGKEQGKLEREQEMLVELYELRLGRPLDEGERVALLQRLASLGHSRVMKVRDELDRDALAAWLVNPLAA